MLQSKRSSGKPTSNNFSPFSRDAMTMANSARSDVIWEVKKEMVIKPDDIIKTSLFSTHGEQAVSLLFNALH